VSESAAQIIGAHQAMAIVTLPDDPRPRKHLWLSDRYESWRSFEGAMEIERRLAGARTIVRKRPTEGRSTGPYATVCLPIRGLLAAPITTREGHRLGVLGLSDRAEGEFTAYNEALLVQLSLMASTAIENAISAQAREANRLKDE